MIGREEGSRGGEGGPSSHPRHVTQNHVIGNCRLVVEYFRSVCHFCCTSKDSLIDFVKLLSDLRLSELDFARGVLISR
jgi:hypothetical protein